MAGAVYAGAVDRGAALGDDGAEPGVAGAAEGSGAAAFVVDYDCKGAGPLLEKLVGHVVIGIVCQLLRGCNKLNEWLCFGAAFDGTDAGVDGGEGLSGQARQ